MKAIIYTKYGPPDVLEFKEVEKPEPKNSVLGVELAGLNISDVIRHQSVKHEG